MKKTLLTTLLLALFALFYSSCKIDQPDFSGYDALSSADSYQPLTKGSTWTYKVDMMGVPDVSTNTVTGTTTTFGGKRYFNLTTTSSLGTYTGYIYVGNHEYISRGTSLMQGITANFVYLKDNAAVGATWTSTLTDDGTVNGIAAKLVGTMVEKNISKTVGTKTYNNVIHTQIDLQYDYQTGSGFTSAALYDYYIAKGVGIILIESSMLGVPVSTTELTSYSIK